MEGFHPLSPPPNSSKKAFFAIFTVLAIIGTISLFSLLNSPSKLPTDLQYQIEEQEFQDFIIKWNKIYSAENEYQARFKIFQENSGFIRIFNSQGHTWTLGINEFADMAPAEFKSIYTPSKFPIKNGENYEDFEGLEVPTQIDWTTLGAVTLVKNQGQCGSCWAFSTTGSVEGAWFLAGHTLTPFSEQELVDCSRTYGNMGCNGGLMDYAFKYIAKYGITTEENYPYTGRNGRCNSEKVKQVAATISSFKDVGSNSVDDLQAAVSLQPVSVAVEADQIAWQFYSGGVVTSSCGTALDHGVLVVGYDMANNPPFWKVKNSWGEQWGEAGYIRIGVVAGKGLCGIQMQPSYPVV
ncbi:unnamed protein product [Blepharisma stoltei]|uniref:Uncharacterized protein n=1 Tax=Blepharisma stoltei TaxID=1481888 RepID=A0AAU9IAW8_9CILI|nr:unnamed protein product [Blepharisma stoltei]